jgi:hypothetical protein
VWISEEVRLVTRKTLGVAIAGIATTSFFSGFVGADLAIKQTVAIADPWQSLAYNIAQQALWQGDAGLDQLQRQARLAHLRHHPVEHVSRPGVVVATTVEPYSADSIQVAQAEQTTADHQTDSTDYPTHTAAADQRATGATGTEPERLAEETTTATAATKARSVDQDISASASLPYLGSASVESVESVDMNVEDNPALENPVDSSSPESSNRQDQPTYAPDWQPGAGFVEERSKSTS